MKIISFILLVIFLQQAPPVKDVEDYNLDLTTEFCKGWDMGYCQGWMFVKGDFEYCPLTPLCPIPDIDEYNFKHGYNRGFSAGVEKAKKKRNQ